MIITKCTKCDETIIYPYEAGEEPYGNVYDKHVCEKCGAISYIQRISFDGETLSEEEAIKRGIKQIN